MPLTLLCRSQVAWWTTFEEKYNGEVAAESSIFGGEPGKKRTEDLRLRVIEHNILVIAKYYSRITVARLAQLLDLPAAEVCILYVMQQAPCSELLVGKLLGLLD